MKQLILVAAPPACGKTYVSERICRSMGQIVYLDKDDLNQMVHLAFTLSNQPFDMDSSFYRQKIRNVEYETILGIALSNLRFHDSVLLNAPFGSEVRDVDFMRRLKKAVASLGARLVLIWVSTPIEICRQRMMQRNSERDLLKLADWENYVKTIDYSAPTQLMDAHAVDNFFVFDATDETTVAASLASITTILQTEKETDL